MYKYTIYASGQIIIFHQPRENPEHKRFFSLLFTTIWGPKTRVLGGYNLTLPGWVMGMVQLPSAGTWSNEPSFNLEIMAFFTLAKFVGMDPNGTSVTLPETNSSPLKIDPWKRRFLLETTIFMAMLVSGRVIPIQLETPKSPANPLANKNGKNR